VTIFDRLTTAWGALRGKSAPQGYGGWYNAGPAFTDAFRSRRAPSRPEMVEAYKSIAYACAQINAGAVTKTPLRLYVTTAKGQATPKSSLVPDSSESRSRIKALCGRKDVQPYIRKAESVNEVADHPWLQAIVAANPDFDQTALLKFTVLSLDITGNAFWVPDDYKLGVPSALWPIHPQYVTPVRRAATIQVDAWQYFGQTYERNEILHFRHVSLKDPYGSGYGPTEAAFEHARLHDSFTSVQGSLLEQGVRPSVIVSPKDANMPMTGAERARFESDINRKLSGGGSGRAWVTDGSIDVHPLTFPPSDLAALDISDNALQRFANCFGVPMSLLKTEDVNLANLEAGLKQHAQFAVEPRCVEIAGALTRFVHNYGRKLRGIEEKDRSWDRLFFAFDDPSGEDQERKAKIFDLYLKNGTKTINEVRTELGDKPVAWGDEPWLPGTLIQPSTMQAREDRAATQAEHGMALADQLANQEQQEDTEDDNKEKPASKAYSPAQKAWNPESLYAKFSEDERAEALILGRAAAERIGLVKQWDAGTLTEEQTLKVVREIATDGAARLRVYADAFLDDVNKGFRDKVGAFFKQATKVVRTTFLSASLAILGPRQPATPAEERSVLSQLKSQAEYMSAFHAEVLSGSQPPNGTLSSRAGMYGASAWGAAQGVRRDVAQMGGAAEEMRKHIGADEPCPVCVEEQAKGWKAIGSLKVIGDSYCRCNCHCTFRFRDSDGEEYETYAQLREAANTNAEDV